MTAVEFLIDKIHKRWYGLEEGETWNDLIEQALEMEKQQIIDAHLLGLIYPLEMEASKQAEQYYSETYKPSA
jgi:hypothetical protein